MYFYCYGIGQVIDHKVAEGLQKLKVNHVSTEKCKAAWDVRGNSERIVPAAHSRHLCAGGIEGKFLSSFIRFLEFASFWSTLFP